MSNASGTEGTRGRRCLVTGAGGFLGRRVVARLIEAGAVVTAQVRGECSLPPDVEVRSGDLLDPDWARRTRAEWRWDRVVHLAGPVASGANDFAEDAKVPRAHLAIALAMSRALPPGWSGRVIHASSMTVYGAAPSLPVREEQALAPRFLYALGKVLAEDVWRASEHSDVWLLRLPGLFSPERRSGGLFHFVQAGLAGRPIELTAREPTLWDVLHVDDAAEAIVRALGSAEPFRGAMNVSYGEVMSLERIARRVAAFTATAAREVEVVDRSGVSHPDFQLDISRARARLGWPPRSFDQRLSELVQAWRAG